MSMHRRKKVHAKKTKLAIKNKKWRGRSVWTVGKEARKV